ncbi:hypothetical protein [Novosphingobium sediminicola]|nr:hypothetical protein [Novosphingobium sediminicola]
MTIVDDKAPTSAWKIRLFIAGNGGLMVNIAKIEQLFEGSLS